MCVCVFLKIKAVYPLVVIIVSENLKTLRFISLSS